MRIAAAEFQQSHFLGLSFATSALSAVAKLGIAFFTQSLLVLVSGLYALALCVPRVTALFSVKAHGPFRSRTEAKDAETSSLTNAIDTLEARKPEEISAVFLVVLGVLFALMSGRTLATGETLPQLGMIPAITFATCAFSKIGVAIYGIVKERGNTGGIIFANKLTSLADGMASIVLTQITLRGAQGQSSDVFDGAFGLIVGGVIVIMGLWLFARVSRQRELSG